MKLLAFVIAVLSVSVFSSCNTMSGLGRDMQKAGTSLENTANRPAEPGY
jgi:predicted small secreted protein